MKLGNETVVNTNVSSVSGHFTIGDVAAVKSVLAKQIYKNPIQTLVQEYLSNARDALRAANNPQGKIEVRLPTDSKANWSVRDFGIGMDEKTVAEVFTSYGVSTKRGDNTQTGGLGIGSKSAFAYADTFVVRAFKDGVRRDFIMATQTAESPAGAFTKVFEEKTGEPDGVEIEIPVSAKDFSAFESATYRAIEFWEHRPKIVSVGVSGYEFDFKAPEVVTASALVFKEHKGTGVFLVIDGIRYPCPEEFYDRYANEVDRTSLEKCIALAKGTVALKFNTGDLVPAGSREAIQDTQGNRKAVEEKAVAAFAELHAFISATLACETIETLFVNSRKVDYLFKHSFVNTCEVSGEVFSYDNSRGALEFGKGVEIRVASNRAKRGRSGKLRMVQGSEVSRRTVTDPEGNAVGIRVREGDVVVYVDEAITSVDIIRKVEQNLKGEVFILVSSETEKNKADILATALDAHRTSTMELQKPARAARASGTVAVMVGLSERKSVSFASFSKCVYVLSNDKLAMQSLFKNDSLLRFVKKQGYDPVGLSSRAVAQLGKEGVTLVSLQEFIDKAAVTVGAGTKAAVVASHVTSLLNDFHYAGNNASVLGFLEKNMAVLNDRFAIALRELQDINAFYERRSGLRDFVPESIAARILAADTGEADKVSKIIERVATFFERIPMLQVVTVARAEGDIAEHLIEYVNHKTGVSV